METKRGQRLVQFKPEVNRRLAVLPFVNLNTDPQDEYFADGMTDELITVVSQLPGLKVIARTSSMRYKGSKKRIATIGRELMVGSLIEGTVRKSRDKVRISLQLVDAETEEYLWAKRYDRRLGDVFEIQSEISNQIARELKLKMVHSLARIAPRQTKDTEAHTLYLRARYSWGIRSEAGVKTAIRYFEEAIAKDPEFPLALVGLADCLSISALFGYAAPKKVYPRAKELAARALRTGAGSAEAHASMAEILMHYSYDWAGAARELERALQINPNYATAHMWRSTCFAVLGQLGAAILEARRAEELDPFAVVTMNEVAKNYYYARKYDDAIARFTRSLEIEPESAYLHKGLAETYVQRSMFKEAILEINKALALSDRSVFYLDSAACVYALSNEHRKARETLAELDRLTGSRFVPFYGRAAAHSSLGENGKAMQLLETAYNERGWLAWLNVDPIFDDLRREKPFHSLLRRLGLESEPVPPDPSGAPNIEVQHQETFEFKSERSRVIFERLASDFLKDYMTLNFMEEKSGWRTSGEISRETGIPLSSLYNKGPGAAAPFRELWKRGLVEMRVSPGERGRGGEVTKIRIAFGKTPVREHVNHLARVVKKTEERAGSGA